MVGTEIKGEETRELEYLEAPHGLEPSPRWVRVKFNGETIADSKRVVLSLERGRLPVYYFPQEDVRMDLLELSEKRAKFPLVGETTYWHVRVAGRLAENAAYGHADPPDERKALAGTVAFKWHLMDAWYEEDEEVIAHARNPYHRVDPIRSSRHIRIELDGVTLAESDRPVLLFETKLPTRYYLPQEDVKMDLLSPTDSQTLCPYKGVASYWTVKVGDKEHKDLVWSYLDPLPEARQIAGLVSFYNEKVDVYVDGELEARPKTVWS